MTGVGERVTANYVEVDRARGNIFFQRNSIRSLSPAKQRLHIEWKPPFFVFGFFLPLEGARLQGCAAEQQSARRQ